jgi:hypothetical protein
MRTVICHYHIYKNSGTSFDRILAHNFGEAHLCFDGPFPYFSINQQELLKVIQRNPSVVAFSSHQITLPVPTALDVNVLPAVFVRHPLLRVQSIYHFKRAEKDGTETSINAEQMDFDAWCRHCLGHPREITLVSNAQTRMLGAVSGEPALALRTKTGMVYDFHQALRNLRTVDLLARTEQFDRDVGRFPALLADHGIEFTVEDTTPANVTVDDIGKSLDERLEQLQAALPGPTYRGLVVANAQDLALYQEVCKRLG